MVEELPPEQLETEGFGEYLPSPATALSSKVTEFMPPNSRQSVRSQKQDSLQHRVQELEKENAVMLEDLRTLWQQNKRMKERINESAADQAPKRSQRSIGGNFPVRKPIDLNNPQPFVQH